MGEWEKFKVGVPAKNGFNNNCMRFDFVSHTSHITSAFDIIENGKIKPSLVSDESILNNKRILVTWVSPNYWSPGFRYGNLKFDFLFGDLVQGKRYYWVESISYGIPACRILITRNYHSLESYDPTLNNGPWWFDESSGNHYYNNNYCLEFMVEEQIDLDCLAKLDFVDHHARYCSVHRNNPIDCSELGIDRYKGGAFFLTRAIVTGVNLAQIGAHFITEGNPIYFLKLSIVEFLSGVLIDVIFSGELNASSSLSIPVMRAIMSSFAFNRVGEAKLLCAMFVDQNTCIQVAVKMIVNATNLQQWEAKLVQEIIDNLV
ncbi:MAG: hypothetical protein HQL90_07420 [Magnetococcales bacterium]|nr:hypothetical protein [Magnetococcales bacterium]